MNDTEVELTHTHFQYILALLVAGNPHGRDSPVYWNESKKYGYGVDDPYGLLWEQAFRVSPCAVGNADKRSDYRLECDRRRELKMYRKALREVRLKDKRKGF